MDKIATADVNSNVKKNSLTYGNGELVLQQDLYKSQIRNFARELLVQNPNASGTSLIMHSTQKAFSDLDSNAGIWRIVYSPSKEGKYAAYVNDELEFIKGTSLDSKVYSGLWDYDKRKKTNLLEEKVLKYGLEGFLNHEEHGKDWNVLNKDVLDEILVSSVKGDNIEVHPAVDFLYKSQLRPGYSGESYSRTQIINILAAKSLSSKEGKRPRTGIADSELDDQDMYIVPLGPVDKADFYVNSSKVNIPNYRQLSTSDQTALGALFWSIGEDGKLPKSQQLEDLYLKSAELGIPPMELLDGIPDIVNYPNYFTRPRSRFTTTTVRPK